METEARTTTYQRNQMGRLHPFQVLQRLRVDVRNRFER